ncbi:MAG: alpha/beta hydrolase [Opitutaceae bacterium]|jgi:acetyl esterase/lipase|nr:alpha/beta hydrolase [Opitutaceae bacterium]
MQASIPPEVKVWPGAVPGEDGFRKPANYKEPDSKGDTQRIGWVSDPTLTLFPVTGPAAQPLSVLVFPGGAYNILAWDKEGTEVAAWLNSLGISAAVLKYRVPRRDMDAPYKAPLQDAQRALRLLRANTKPWAMPVQKLGVIGFSAGGNLAVMTATHFSDTTYPTQDAADSLSCRPDFVMPIYPAYLGDEKNAGPLSPLVTVTRDTPPVFVAVTDDDALRGVNAASFYIELKKAHVPSELHIYAKGGHGYGLRPSENPVSQWPKRAEEWLRAMKILGE